MLRFVRVSYKTEIIFEYAVAVLKPRDLFRPIRNYFIFFISSVTHEQWKFPSFLRVVWAFHEGVIAVWKTLRSSFDLAS